MLGESRLLHFRRQALRSRHFPALRPRLLSRTQSLTPGPTLAALAGLAVVAWLVWQIGPAALAAEMRQLSWRLGLVMLPQALVSLLDAVGWRYTFLTRLPPLGTLVAARLAGEAVNDTTPTATLGGEPVKAWMVTRAGVSMEEGLASVIITKTAFVAAQLGFLGLGLALVGWRLHPNRALIASMAFLLAVGTVAVAGFAWIQQRGLFSRGGRVLRWLGIDATGRLAELDALLRTYYRSRPDRFALAVLFHFLGWAAGSLEVWLALHALAQPVDLATALVIEAFATGVRSASFLVPAAVGVQEGGLVAIFVGLGLPPGTGLAFGLVRRIREATWSALGYAVLAAWRGFRVPAKGSGG